MRQLLSLLPPLLAFGSGCADCVPVALTPNERVWVSAYQPGQRLIFRSNRGTTNVFTAQPVREWHDNQNCNQLESGRYQPIRATLALTSATNYGSDSPSFSILAYKTNPSRAAELTFNMAGLLLQGSDPKTGQPLRPAPSPLTLAGGRRFPDARLIRNGQNAIYLRGSQLRAVWWDAQAGLLRYELVSGEVFDWVP